MSDDELVKATRELWKRLGLSDEELAAVMGCSLPIARGLRSGERIPRKRAKRAAIERCVLSATTAQSRADLRIAG